MESTLYAQIGRLGMSDCLAKRSVYAIFRQCQQKTMETGREKAVSRDA